MLLKGIVATRYFLLASSLVSSRVPLLVFAVPLLLSWLTGVGDLLRVADVGDTLALVVAFFSAKAARRALISSRRVFAASLVGEDGAVEDSVTAFDAVEGVGVCVGVLVVALLES